MTQWIETRANALMGPEAGAIKRMGFDAARRAATTHSHDYLQTYVQDLGAILDMDVIRGSRHSHGRRSSRGEPACNYWARIAEVHGLDLTVVNDEVDPTFRFMTLDWDGKIRMDPSSPYAMRRLIGLKDASSTSPLPATPITTATASSPRAAD